MTEYISPVSEGFTQVRTFEAAQNDLRDVSARVALD